MAMPWRAMTLAGLPASSCVPRRIDPADGRVVFGQCALAVPGEHHGNAEPLDQAPELTAGVAGDRAATDHDARPLGREQELQRGLDGLCVGARLAHGHALGEFGNVDLGHGHLHVERNLHVHRPWPSGEHGVEGAMHHERRVGGTPQVEVALGHRRREEHVAPRRAAIAIKAVRVVGGNCE